MSPVDRLSKSRRHAVHSSGGFDRHSVNLSINMPENQHSFNGQILLKINSELIAAYGNFVHLY